MNKNQLSSAQVGFAITLLAGCPGGDGGGGGGDASQWWTTCGDPVCQGYTGPFDGVPLCVDEVEGDACDGEPSCDPEDACNALLTCAVEDPKAGDAGCPISLASAKTDIRYLDDPALRLAADEALALRLATWRYTSEPEGARPHLGFVIDDRPASAAVAANGQKVDLYGYASLALAAVQVQQAEIAQLRLELDLLRATCPVD